MTTNHPAHGPVSLDRLHQIREILSKAAAQSDGGNLGYAMADAVKVIDVAIAARNAEPQRNPVLAYADSYRDMAKRGVESIPVWSVITDLERNIAPLYTAPSAPVSVPDLKPVGFLFVSDDGAVAYSPAGCPMKGFNLIGPIYGDVNACRAAMLQSDGTLTNEGTMQLSGNSEQIEPVSNRDELPLDYLQGHKDGLEWAAQLAEANHPQTGDWLYDDPIDLARAIRKGPDMPTVQGGNSPVIPDGWVMVPEDPTHEMLEAGDEQFGTYDVYRRMIEAAPKLE